MLVKTRKSTYEIKDKWIRKLDGPDSNRHSIGKDWVLFDRLMYPPEVGKSLIIFWMNEVIQTTTVTEIC